MTLRKPPPDRKRCPYCERENPKIYREDYNGLRSQVRCTEFCGARGPLRTTERGAVIAWNNRRFEE